MRRSRGCRRSSPQTFATDPERPPKEPFLAAYWDDPVAWIAIPLVPAAGLALRGSGWHDGYRGVISIVPALGGGSCLPVPRARTKGAGRKDLVVRPEQEQRSVRMRVVGSRGLHLVGVEGTVERTYGTSRRVAVHVRSDNGRWQLLWPRELEPLREE